MIETLMIWSAAIVAILRLLGVKSIAYQAVAHILVGFIFGYALSGDAKPGDRRTFLVVAVSLSLLELLAFLVSKLT